MFRIADGREHFYQWDLDRQIIVEDSSITEVHFCNRTDDCSLVVEVIDGLANVPNVILQKSFDIRVFGYDGKATRYDEAFKVKARTKPTDYVYTEVEIKRYEDLSKRIDEIEEKGFSEEVVDNAVKDYFEKNPISFDGYATEAYVDNAISNIPEVDLSKHALKSEVPTKVSQLQNDSKFITRDEVPQTDLSEYAKKSEIPDVSNFLTSVPSEYITESELNAKGYATEKYVDDAIASIDLPEGGGAPEVIYLNFNGIAGSWIRATEEQAAIFDRLASGEQLAIYIRETSAYAPVDIFVTNADNIYFVLHSTPWSSSSVQTQVVEFHANKYNGAWDIKENRHSLKTYVTADEVNTIVNDALEGIATAEGGAY